MKSWIFPFILLLILTVSCSDHKHPEKPLAKNGILDLHDWDFENYGPTNMSGSWQFYWQRFLPPDMSNTSLHQNAFSLVNLPSIWNDYVINGKEIGSSGYATYRLKIILPDTARTQNIAIKTSIVSSAFKLFINGKKVIENGVPGPSFDTTEPEYLPSITSIDSKNRELDIVLHVSNFNQRKGGARKLIKIGLLKDLDWEKDLNIIYDMFLFGAIIVIGVYHIGLYWVRKKDKAPLFFALFCIVTAIRILIDGDIVFVKLFPDLRWEIFMKVRYGSFAIVIPLFCLFLNSLYSQDFSKKILSLVTIISGLYFVIILFGDASYYTYLINYYHVLAILCSGYAFYILYFAIKRHQTSGFIFAVGFFILFLTLMNDILFAKELIHWGTYTPLGVFFFILSLAFLMALQYSNIFNKMELLKNDVEEKSEKLEKYSNNLEGMVQKKTHQLKQALAVMEEAKEKAEAANEAKTEFLANISHELKTPMQGILGFAKLGLDRYNKTGSIQSKNYYDEIYISGKRLMVLLNNLLDLSTLETGKMRYAFKLEHIVPLIEETLNEFETMGDHNDVTIKKMYEVTTDQVVIDKIKISQVFRNLIQNAIKYSSNDKVVTIEVKSLKNTITISVLNKGIGIPENELDSIFEKFTQSSFTKNGAGGTGLGLSISKSIIDDHNGKIWAENFTNDQVKFIISLPLYRP